MKRKYIIMFGLPALLLGSIGFVVAFIGILMTVANVLFGGVGDGFVVLLSVGGIIMVLFAWSLFKTGLKKSRSESPTIVP